MEKEVLERQIEDKYYNKFIKMNYEKLRETGSIKTIKKYININVDL